MTIPEALALALRHHQQGRLAEAEALYGQILAVEPQHADALHLLGLLAHQTGHRELAVSYLARAIALRPDTPLYLSNLGEVYFGMGRLEEAIAASRRAIKLEPAPPEPYNNLGNALAAQGRYDEAVPAFRGAIARRPGQPEPYNNLGNALHELGHLEEAAAALDRAVQLKPDYAVAHNNRGSVFASQGWLEEAMAAYRRALQLQPIFPEALSNLGIALRQRGALAEAVGAHRQVLAWRPDLSLVYRNLATALKDQGRLEEAEAAFRRGLALRPGDAALHSSVLFAMQYRDEAGSDALALERQRWEERHAQPLARCIVPHANDRDPERRLRIGYVSPDFREHAVGYFLGPLLGAHDPAQVEVFCYADATREDGFTERFRGQAAHWRKIPGLRDEQVAELVRRDAIDILVDLAGHTASNRLLVFARKPAPVQVTYLGYCDSTGLRAMDYRLTDAYADPPGAGEASSEALVRLPDCAWCYEAPGVAPPVAPPPGDRAGHVTFGCFNARPKITEAMLAVWARILLAAPGSRLWLKGLGYHEPSMQAALRAPLVHAGVAPERIELMPLTATFTEHLAAYGRVDIALDTFPYGGTTTTCEALWMGVPVVTLAGPTHASRVGVSLLSNAGLPELVAHSVDEYVAIAVKLAAEAGRRRELRAALRAQMHASPLMDGPRLARGVEAAYREMWRAWCAR